MIELKYRDADLLFNTYKRICTTVFSPKYLTALGCLIPKKEYVQQLWTGEVEMEACCLIPKKEYVQQFGVNRNEIAYVV